MEVCTLSTSHLNNLQLNIYLSNASLDITQRLWNQFGGSPPHSPLTATHLSDPVPQHRILLPQSRMILSSPSLCNLLAVLCELLLMWDQPYRIDQPSSYLVNLQLNIQILQQPATITPLALEWGYSQSSHPRISQLALMDFPLQV